MPTITKTYTRALLSTLITSLLSVRTADAQTSSPASRPAEAPITLPSTEQLNAGQPRINGARVVGATPSRPFLFKIPATGDGPLAYAADNLPAGITLDTKTGIITGALQSPGATVVTLHITGPKGEDRKPLIIVAGDHKLLLTPPMGWNSWNVWAGAVDQPKIQAAADEFISTHLADHGFTYVNIDDTWEGKRDDKGMIQTNNKFPDMKALGDYIHSKGLHFGIYSSPGPQTCARFEASYNHEDQDAQQWANWGVDYIKYDWCSYGNLPDVKGKKDVPTYQKPYQVLRTSLDKSNRDIVYSLCQYGMGNVWEWGANPDVAANCWRTTGDIRDTWDSMSKIGFGQNGHEKFAAPGHWNDPDMLVVGIVGWGKTHPSRLTQNEQLTHISLWSILASPLLIGCDLTKLDDFTTNILTNDEVLAVNQDPLGQQGYRVANTDQTQIWKRQLADGTLAVGLFNLNPEAHNVTVNFSDLGITGTQRVRDLWQLKDLPPAANSLTLEVPRHGVALLKIGTPTSETETTQKILALYNK